MHEPQGLDVHTSPLRFVARPTTGLAGVDAALRRQRSGYRVLEVPLKGAAHGLGLGIGAFRGRGCASHRVLDVHTSPVQFVAIPTTGLVGVDHCIGQ